MKRTALAAAAAAAVIPIAAQAGGTLQWVPVARAYQNVPTPEGVTRIRWGAGNLWAETTTARPIIDCRPNGSLAGVKLPTIPSEWSPGCEAWMTPSEDAPLTPSTSPNAPPEPPKDRAPIIDMVGAALGSPGVGVHQIKDTTEQPAKGSGAFRVPCEFVRWGYFDPIVYPGIEGRSHLHAFFGNAGVNASSDYKSLVSTGSSSCRGGTVDRTAYWVPAMVDMSHADANGGAGKPVRPTGAMFYYKRGFGNFDPKAIKAWPDGLRMIAGASMATGLQPDAGLVYTFKCAGTAGPAKNQPTIPKCVAGQTLRMEVNFPECWDGKNLDSPNHRDHMAYRMAQPDRKCPASHPVDIPRINIFADYAVTSDDDTSKWRLASDMYDQTLPGGYSAHGDFDDGWDPVIKEQIVANCIRADADCHAHLIGNGKALY